MGVKQLDFDKLIEPYKEGGTEESPVTRTLGTIAAKLMVSYKIPPDVAGAAIYKVFYKMAYEGLEFKGNDKYGSKGAELFSCIKAQCADMTQNKSAEQVIQKLHEVLTCTRNCKHRTAKLEHQTRTARVKNFWTAPRESYAYCLFWIISGTIIAELIWRYIAE